MSERVLHYRNHDRVLYLGITCPTCGHQGCEISNATAPTIYHCPRCDEGWNPDNLPAIERERKTT